MQPTDGLALAVIASETSSNPPTYTLPQTRDGTGATDSSQHSLPQKPNAFDHGTANTMHVQWAHEPVSLDADALVAPLSTVPAPKWQDAPRRVRQSSQRNVALEPPQLHSGAAPLSLTPTLKVTTSRKSLSEDPKSPDRSQHVVPYVLPVPGDSYRIQSSLGTATTPLISSRSSLLTQCPHSSVHALSSQPGSDRIESCAAVSLTISADTKEQINPKPTPSTQRKITTWTTSGTNGPSQPHSIHLTPADKVSSLQLPPLPHKATKATPLLHNINPVILFSSDASTDKSYKLASHPVQIAATASSPPQIPLPKQTNLHNYFKTKGSSYKVTLEVPERNNMPDCTIKLVQHTLPSEQQTQRGSLPITIGSNTPPTTCTPHPLPPQDRKDDDHPPGQPHPPPRQNEEPYLGPSPHLPQTFPSPINQHPPSDTTTTNDPRPIPLQQLRPAQRHCKHAIHDQLLQTWVAARENQTALNLDQTSPSTQSNYTSIIMETEVTPMNTSDQRKSPEHEEINNHQPQGSQKGNSTDSNLNTHKPHRRTGYKRLLLQYNSQPLNQTRLTYFQSASLTCDLQDSWGHSLVSIDTTSTFRVFLQNPNGISPSSTNYSLLQDLHTSKKYGAAVISLPETILIWEAEGTIGHLHRMLRQTWQHSSISYSRAKEEFISSYQPGGTATMICDNWTSRVLGRGEDPHGLGRWSYMILRGKGTTKVAVITAYNVSQKYHLEHGERTAYKQQYRLLSAAIRNNNLPIAPNPRRQFIMDLQAWIEHLIHTEHDIILSMDANEPYNPDIPGTVHSLPYPKD